MICSWKRKLGLVEVKDDDKILGKSQTLSVGVKSVYSENYFSVTISI
jgi:hypothetical protein